MRLLTALLLTALLTCCGTKDDELDTAQLSSMLSISNLSKIPVRDPSDPSRISGVSIQVDVINVGYWEIDVPFLMTWYLVDSEGDPLGSASKRVEAGLKAGGRVSVFLTVSFPPVSSLEGVSDVVTFDPLGQMSEPLSRVLPSGGV
jgi:hypothetical protein